MPQRETPKPSSNLQVWQITLYRFLQVPIEARPQSLETKLKNLIDLAYFFPQALNK